MRAELVRSAYARNTWRYLRLAMVGVVLVLGAAVVVERVKVRPGCFQTSISAYYHTPVHAVFIGALVTLGVCLISLRGSTDREDLLLNIAGLLAPIVAFVPTRHYSMSCVSVHPPIGHMSAGVANNVVALQIVSAVALVIVGGVLVFSEATLTARIGGVVGALLWVATLVWFVAFRAGFLGHAHIVAAVGLFGCIIGAAFDNAFDTDRHGWQPLYISLAVLMAAAVLIPLIVDLATNWQYWMIVTEALVLALFMVFWLAQTVELWDDGIRLDGKRQPIRPTRLFGSRASTPEPQGGTDDQEAPSSGDAPGTQPTTAYVDAQLNWLLDQAAFWSRRYNAWRCFYEFLHYAFGVPATVLAAVAGATAFAKHASASLVGAFATTAAALTAIQIFVRPDRRARFNKEERDALNALTGDLEDFRHSNETNAITPAEALEELKKTRARYQAIRDRTFDS